MKRKGDNNKGGQKKCLKLEGKEDETVRDEGEGRISDTGAGKRESSDPDAGGSEMGKESGERGSVDTGVGGSGAGREGGSGDTGVKKNASNSFKKIQVCIYYILYYI